MAKLFMEGYKKYFITREVTSLLQIVEVGQRVTKVRTNCHNMCVCKCVCVYISVCEHVPGCDWWGV